MFTVKNIILIWVLVMGMGGISKKLSYYEDSCDDYIFRALLIPLWPVYIATLGIVWLIPQVLNLIDKIYGFKLRSLWKE